MSHIGVTKEGMLLRLDSNEVEFNHTSEREID